MRQWLCVSENPTRLLTAAGLVLALAAGGTAAAPFNSALSIDARVELSGSSIAPEGGATRSGIATLTSGGVDGTASVDDLLVTNLPLSDGLTDVGDGLGLELETSGSGLDAISALSLDFLIDLNNSSTDTVFEVVFDVNHRLSVEAEGADALSTASFLAYDASTQSDLTAPQESFADSYFGPTSDSASGNSFFTVLLDPLAAFSIEGYGDVFGAVNSAGFGLASDTYSASAFTSLSIESVTARPASAVPLPSTLALFAVASLALMLRRRRAG